eukprot:IDg16462t1
MCRIDVIPFFKVNRGDYLSGMRSLERLIPLRLYIYLFLVLVISTYFPPPPLAITTALSNLSDTETEIRAIHEKNSTAFDLVVLSDP